MKFILSTCHRQLGSEFVRIEVGSDLNKKEFLIHKKLLSVKAPVFGKMFNGGFKEAETNCATLPKDDLKAFKSFVEWLYRETIRTIRLDVPEDDDSQSSEMFKLYLFASKYLLIELADRSLTGYIRYEIIKNIIPSPGALGRNYAQSPPGSKVSSTSSKSIQIQPPIVGGVPISFVMRSRRTKNTC